MGKKEQDTAGKKGHVEIGQQFSGTSILVQVPGEKPSTVQLKHRNEVKKWARQVDGGRDHQKSLKPSDPFPERSRRMCA